MFLSNILRVCLQNFPGKFFTVNFPWKRGGKGLCFIFSEKKNLRFFFYNYFVDFRLTWMYRSWRLTFESNSQVGFCGTISTKPREPHWENSLMEAQLQGLPKYTRTTGTLLSINTEKSHWGGLLSRRSENHWWVILVCSTRCSSSWRSRGW